MHGRGANGLLFVKLGGSLITDKRQQATPRRYILRQLAREMRAARDADSTLQVLLGHGSGSYGHWEASQYQTRKGVQTPEEWYGFARVSAAALHLNRLVVESFVEAGVPLISLQPAASVCTHRGEIMSLETKPLRRALAVDLVPLIFGDVAFDDTLGGTILSTEDLFAYLAEILKPTWILLLGNAPGVLNGDREVIPVITPDNFAMVQEHIHGSGYTDVTGGMADKVCHSLDLVNRFPQLRVRILSGLEPYNLQRVLRDPAGFPEGTLICRASTAS